MRKLKNYQEHIGEPKVERFEIADISELALKKKTVDDFLKDVDELRNSVIKENFDKIMIETEGEWDYIYLAMIGYRQESIKDFNKRISKEDADKAKLLQAKIAKLEEDLKALKGN